MRVVCVLRNNTDYFRPTVEWMENFYRQTGRKIEAMDPDANPGFCEAYDIVEYPTILAIGERGEVRASWRGTNFPLVNEVLYYML